MTAHDYIMKLTGEMTPELRYDLKEDFSVWQKRARAKLEELLGLPLEKPQNNNFKVVETVIKNDIVYTHFIFESEEGYTVPCCMLRKADTTEKTPLCICLQGHSSGMHISIGECKFEGDASSVAGGRDFAIQAVENGMTAIAIEQRYMGEKGFPGRPLPACGAASGYDDANQAMSALLIGRTAIGERVWDIMATLDIAEKYFSDLYDKDKVICTGNSGGGTVSYYVACMDERITLTAPSCGVCEYEDSIMSINHCPCNFIPNIRKYFRAGDLGALIAPRKLVMICGADDPIFPLDGVKKSFELSKKVYSHLGKDENCALVIGNGGHKYYPDDSWPVVTKMI